MKKIVFTGNTAWSMYNFRLGLFRNLKENGYTVIVIAPYDEYAKYLKQEFEYYDIAIDNKGMNPFKDISTVYSFYRLYKIISPDLIFHYTIKPNIYGTMAAKVNNIPSISITTGLGYAFINESLITKIVKTLYKISFQFAEQVWFLNSDDRKIFLQNNIIPSHKAFTLSSEGIDTKDFMPIEVEQKDNIFVFLLIGRMLWDKGIGEYVKAAKIIKSKYKNVEFQLLGFLGVENRTAISKEQMQKWIDAGYVNYLGVSDNVKNEIAKANCIVLPSYREGTPRVLLESASMAKPIITTDSVGCRDVVDDGINGYLCEVRNAEDLADKMEMMLRLSEDKKKLMGEAGRKKIINEFDESIVINKYLENINKILKIAAAR